jgi:hypothetical protein
VELAQVLWREEQGDAQRQSDPAATIVTNHTPLDGAASPVRIEEGGRCYSQGAPKTADTPPGHIEVDVRWSK